MGCPAASLRGFEGGGGGERESAGHGEGRKGSHGALTPALSQGEKGRIERRREGRREKEHGRAGARPWHPDRRVGVNEARRGGRHGLEARATRREEGTGCPPKARATGRERLDGPLHGRFTIVAKSQGITGAPHTICRGGRPS